MNKSILSIAAIFFSGCIYLPGDGGMGVYGVITNYSGQECKINMQTKKGSKVVDHPLDVTDNKYTSFFTVSPRDTTYQVNLVCSGMLLAEKYVIYPSDLSKEGYVELNGSVN